MSTLAWVAGIWVVVLTLFLIAWARLRRGAFEDVETDDWTDVLGLARQDKRDQS